MTDEDLDKLSEEDRQVLQGFRKLLLRHFGMASPLWKPVFQRAITQTKDLRTSCPKKDSLCVSYDLTRGIVQVKRLGGSCNPLPDERGLLIHPPALPRTIVNNDSTHNEELVDLNSEAKSGVFPSIRYTGCC